MYDELLAEINETQENCRDNDFVECDYIGELLIKVADTIKELRRCEAVALENLADEHNKRLKIEQRYRWISVTERLPKPYTWVLVSAKKRKWAFNAFHNGAQWKDAVLNSLIVTHWMPLPEPPEEG